MAKQRKILPILALTTASVLWGVNVPLVKLGLQTIPVPILISVKFLAASLILLPFALKTWRPLHWKTLALIVLSSLLSITFATIALNEGLKYAPSINVGVIDLLAPLILGLLSVEFLKEHISPKTFTGILVAFAGASIIIGRPWDVSLTGQTVLLGNVLIFLAMLSGVISTVITKPLLKKMSSYQATFLFLFIGTLPIVPFAFHALKDWSIHDINTGGYISVIYGIIAITLANFLFMYGLRYKKAHSVGIFRYIEPVVIIIAAWFILGEHVSSKFAIGAALVFLGIYLAEVHKVHKLHKGWFNRF